MQRGVLALAAVAAFWTLPAFAQTVTIPQDVFLTTQGEGQYLAKDLLLGAKVHNAEGQIIGDIEDLILNADNQVQGVVMGVGGFAGFGEKRVGISLAALQIKNENGIVTVSLPQATKEVLDALAAVRAQDAAQVAGRPRHREGEGALRQGLRHREGSLRQGQARAGEGLRRREDAGRPALEKAQEATKDAYEAAKKAMEACRDACSRYRGNAARDADASGAENATGDARRHAAARLALIVTAH